MSKELEELKEQLEAELKTNADKKTAIVSKIFKECGYLFNKGFDDAVKAELTEFNAKEKELVDKLTAVKKAIENEDRFVELKQWLELTIRTFENLIIEARENHSDKFFYLYKGNYQSLTKVLEKLSDKLLTDDRKEEESADKLLAAKKAIENENKIEEINKFISDKIKKTADNYTQSRFLANSGLKDITEVDARLYEAQLKVLYDVKSFINIINKNSSRTLTACGTGPATKEEEQQVINKIKEFKINCGLPCGHLVEIAGKPLEKTDDKQDETDISAISLAENWFKVSDEKTFTKEDILTVLKDSKKTSEFYKYDEYFEKKYSGQYPVCVYTYSELDKRDEDLKKKIIDFTRTDENFPGKVFGFRFMRNI